MVGGWLIYKNYYKLTKLEVHTFLDNYPNKHDWKATVNYTDIATAVWTSVTRSLNVDVTLGSSEINEIATAIEAAIINEGDGQLVINAIVQAIGNINVPASVIASAVRTELTLELDRIDTNIGSRSSQDSVYGLY